MISGCMHGESQIAKLALFEDQTSSCKQWIIKPVCHERSVYILITNVRCSNGRLHPCSFVMLLHYIRSETLQVVRRDPGLRGW